MAQEQESAAGDPFAGRKLDIELDEPVESEGSAGEVESPVVEERDGAEEREAAVESSVASWLRQRGHELSDDVTDEDVDSYLGELQSASEEREQLRRKVQEYEAWLARRQEPERKESPEKPAPAAEKPKREVPEFDPEWLKLVKEDEQGNIVPAFNGVDPTVPQKVREYLSWKNRELERYLREPEYLREVLGLDGLLEERDEKIRNQALEEFQSRLEQQKQQEFIQQFASRNTWLYQGEKTRELSRDGELFERLVDEHLQAGHPPERAVRYAKHDFRDETGRTPWEQEEREKPSPRDRKIKFRNRLQENGKSARIEQPPVRREPADPAAHDDGTFSNRNMRRILDAHLDSAVTEQL